ncbi:HAD-IC family P-type ATPase [Pyxidicoccus fallax]|uniref:HAD-IC family P-type ATPase n=1 Tax=Pyxidicoccus fallax TaxID=394095 RepID=A0A848LT87_9BACT|nr:HAD-IC family P-type ATPase [Pyxidicoccus fallax]NMO20889.1 HAD-IC family P-type ATPase [Pyxidicoccus fallax]NPC81894.1 HAD-IC family P-type ATPase [Pyxidicoccus fallax]
MNAQPPGESLATASPLPGTPAGAAPPWHALPPEAVLSRVGSREEGLRAEEADERLSRYGPNVLKREKAEGPLKLLWRQINSPLIWVLIASAVLAIAMGKVTDGLVVAAVVVLNTLIGFVQEYRAGKAIEALSAMVPENATVMRGGHKVSVPASRLVPGDVVHLASGDKVPADMRLLSSRNLQVEEAALTGESVPAQKHVAAVAEDSELGDRASLVFGGTLVTSGTGAAVVVATGGTTELGRISTLLSQATDLQTPLTKALATIGKYITIAILVVSAVLLVVSLMRGYAVSDAVLVAITLAVAAIPEGLPAIVTIALAIGVQRMAARRAVIRKLPAVETLGSTTVICSDKTGTLTRNEMTVQALWTPSGRYAVSGVGYAPRGELRRDGQVVGEPPVDVRELLLAGALCNDAALQGGGDGKWEMTGDPTEGALVVSAEKAGLRVEELRQRHARVDAIPFESEHQFMATLHEAGPERRRIFLKGAPEVVLRRCALGNGVSAEAVLAEVERLAGQGMRVLAVAHREVPASHAGLRVEDVEGGLELLGLQGMIDPPREEAIAAVKACHEAGIVVKMITGDHHATAEAIGAQLGLQPAGSRGVTGAQLAAMDDTRLTEVATTTNVFARVAPEHKLRLVRALQTHQHVVAMTGDGVNDAPALKQANIGVAMGITGTAVSKEAADIVLTDDNFASIAAAVEEGRRVYDNLIKSLAFVLPTNLGLALILMFGVAFFPIQNIDGNLVPLMAMLPTQLLWINLVATVSLALPLAFEAREADIMRRAPRAPDAPVLNRFVLMRTGLVALLMAAGAIGLFLWEYQRELPRVGHAMALAEAQTMAVNTVISFQIFYLLMCRTLIGSLRKVGLFSNRAVFVGVGALVLLQAAFMYLPFMQRVFGTAPLAPGAIALSVLIGAVVLPVVGLEKWLLQRRGYKVVSQVHRDREEPPRPGHRERLPA